MLLPITHSSRTLHFASKWERDVIMDSYHRKVDVGCIQLHVDLTVDGGFAGLLEVLSHLRAHVSVREDTDLIFLLHASDIPINNERIVTSPTSASAFPHIVAHRRPTNSSVYCLFQTWQQVFTPHNSL